VIENNRILVIDDDPDIRQTYQRILSSVRLKTFPEARHPLFKDLDSSSHESKERSYDLSIVESGEAGISEVKASLKNKNPFAAAFVDLMMPGLNGAETAAWMWMIDPHIKIVMVTAYDNYMSEDLTLVAGRDDLFYLRKPFNCDEIRQFAVAFTNQWSLERETERLTKDLRIVQEELEDMNQNLQKKVEEQTTMLIQSDKMASIGLLAAGVAHEINNPISFINCNLSSLKSYSTNILILLEKYHELEKTIEKGGKAGIEKIKAEIHNLWENQKMDFIMKDMAELIDDSLEGTKRVSKIVSDLKSFARVKEEDIDAVDLNEVIDASINITWNQLKYKIELIKDYGDLPKVRCFVQKMSQVFMNLLTNASQAIEDKGTIRVSTRHIKARSSKKDEHIELRFSDDGAGIPKEHLTKIFDPFFTTKPVGIGTGLGLKITYDIINAHGGKIMVESEAGKGTTFIITLPLNTKL